MSREYNLRNFSRVITVMAVLVAQYSSWPSAAMDEIRLVEAGRGTIEFMNFE